jgi:hypothetical protein
MVSKARAVAISIVYPENDTSLEAALRHLRFLLPPEVALIAGGRAAPAYDSVLDEIQVIQTQDLFAFCEILDNLARTSSQKAP